MARRKNDALVGRRGFLKGAGLAPAALGAALAVPLSAPLTTKPAEAQTPARAPSIPPAPNLEAERGRPNDAEPLTQTSCGADFMLDVMRGLGIEHAAAFVGSSFRGLHESIINDGMLTEPNLDFLSCMHEEVSVAMCHGYAKIEGKPMAAMMHDTVGLQHGSMAIYNAYADRAPIFLITPSAPDRAHPQDHGAVRPFGAGRRRDRARLRQMGRQARLAAALGGIRDARLEIRDDAAIRSGAAGHFHGPAGRPDRRKAAADKTAAAEDRAAAG